MKAATYAPMYCAMYPALAEIARKHGYALAVHGTLGRDMDLICIPWTEQPAKPKEVVAEIISTFHVRTVGEPDQSHHGRERWTITVGFGECFIDLSFMPRAADKGEASHTDQSATAAGDVARGEVTINMEEMAALRRFDETCEDGEDYDVSKYMMRRLAAIGLIQYLSFGRYEFTEFGRAILASHSQTSATAKPFKTYSAHVEASKMAREGLVQFPTAKTLVPADALPSNEVIRATDSGEKK